MRTSSEISLYYPSGPQNPMTNVFIKDTERRYTGLRKNCETWYPFLVQCDPHQHVLIFFLFDSSHSIHPWRKKWQFPVFLPRKSHGKRSLVSYTVPKGCKELDTSEQLSTAQHSNHGKCISCLNSGFGVHSFGD